MHTPACTASKGATIKTRPEGNADENKKTFLFFFRGLRTVQRLQSLVKEQVIRWQTYRLCTASNKLSRSSVPTAEQKKVPCICAPAGPGQSSARQHPVFNISAFLPRQRFLITTSHIFSFSCSQVSCLQDFQLLHGYDQEAQLQEIISPGSIYKLTRGQQNRRRTTKVTLKSVTRNPSRVLLYSKHPSVLSYSKSTSVASVSLLVGLQQVRTIGLINDCEWRRQFPGGGANKCYLHHRAQGQSSRGSMMLADAGVVSVQAHLQQGAPLLRVTRPD